MNYDICSVYHTLNMIIYVVYLLLAFSLRHMIRMMIYSTDIRPVGHCLQLQLLLHLHPLQLP